MVDLLWYHFHLTRLQQPMGSLYQHHTTCRYLLHLLCAEEAEQSGEDSQQLQAVNGQTAE